MQVGVGRWLMFEDRWAAVLRFLSRCSFVVLIAVFCVAVLFELHFTCCICLLLFFCCSFVCDAVFFALLFLRVAV